MNNCLLIIHFPFFYECGVNRFNIVTLPQFSKEEKEKNQSLVIVIKYG